MKTKIMALATASLMLLGSCENNFDPNLYGSLTPENYPTTEAEYTSYMMTSYLPFSIIWTYDMGSAGVQHGWFVPVGGVLRMFDATSDICGVVKTHGGGWTYLTQANYDQSVYYWRGSVSDDGSLNHFPKTAQITRITEIIGTLEKAPENILKPEVRNHLLGEARICRGLMMYYLLHNFGPVRVVLDPSKVTDPATLGNTERPTLDEMCGWIYDDFDYATKNAPEIAPNKGRFTADFARFCLMRHCLNEGAHIEGYYQKSMEMYNELKGKYSLYDKGANPYAELFRNANKFNNEIIMAVSADETADGNPKHGNFWPFLMHALPGDMAKEDPFPMGGGWIQLYSVDQNFYNTFESSDKRRQTIVTSYKSQDGSTVGRANIGVRWNGYIINKWPQETLTTFQGQDFPMARYADVLLMYAELDARMNNRVSADAVKAVNDVRHRAGLGDLQSSATSGKDAFLDAILLERAHELFFEGNRKIDLIRYNRYAQAVYQGKGCMPTHQYMPIPNYAVEQAQNEGHVLEQTWTRDGWEEDKAKANPSTI